MEDRKRRFDDKTDVRKKIEEVVKKLFAMRRCSRASMSSRRMLTCRTTALAARGVAARAMVHERAPRIRPRIRFWSICDYTEASPGTGPIGCIFIAADQAVLTRLRDATRVALAWESIVDDVDEDRLNIDQNQLRQAEKESQAASAVLPRAARECFKWLLCPVQDEPTATKPRSSPSLLTRPAAIQRMRFAGFAARTNWSLRRGRRSIFGPN